MSQPSLIRETWTFDCDASDTTILPITVFCKFYGGMCISSQTRFNYSRDDASSLVEYLNSRSQP